MPPYPRSPDLATWIRSLQNRVRVLERTGRFYVEDWQTPTYDANCTGNLRYALEGGRVWLDGDVTAIAGNTTTIATLPVGYRPDRTTHASGWGSVSGTPQVIPVTISTGGAITAPGGMDSLNVTTITWRAA